jgi:ABC-2 type transport system permease protein
MRSPSVTSLRSGLTGGLVELRQAFSGAALIGQPLWPGATLVALFFLRHREFKASSFTIGALMLPSAIGMFVAFGMMLMVQYVPADREEGTLLRVKATPNGILGYLASKLVTSSLSVLVYLAMIGVPGAFIVGGLQLANISWATPGLGARPRHDRHPAPRRHPWAVVPSPRSVGYVSLPLLGLVAVSGIFYPITVMPGWLQGIAQAFPVYWLGLGMRSALLPAGAASVEIAGSWRSPQTAAVLGAWALAGLIIAPSVLKRMARRESGSRVAERRQRALHRVR